jgi:hypothetical protein
MSLNCEHCQKKIGFTGSPALYVTIGGSSSNEVGQITKYESQEHHFCGVACNQKFLEHKNVKSVLNTIKMYKEIISGFETDVELQEYNGHIGYEKIIEFFQLSILVLRKKIKVEDYQKQVEEFLEVSFDTEYSKWYCLITRILQNTLNLTKYK